MKSIYGKSNTYYISFIAFRTHGNRIKEIAVQTRAQHINDGNKTENLPNWKLQMATVATKISTNLKISFFIKKEK